MLTDEKTLPQAKRNLSDAVHRLTAPQHRYLGDALRSAPSRYHQLCQEIAGTQGENHTPPKSMPPLWIDAVQLLADIDRQARRWEPGAANTVTRLQVMADKSWRPQDTEHVFSISITVAKWSDSIDQLLDPEHVKHISTACPSCSQTHVYRKDSAGDRVKQPALRIVTNTGCECQACGAFWGPSKYLFLCKLLGFELPEGVLE